MDEQYDAIVMGTGLTECIVSGMLSVDGYKVLHLDRNDYYGAESASLSLQQLYEKFRAGAEPPAALGASRDYNIDLIPKFLMADGKLVRILSHLKVNRYLEFTQVDGCYVVKGNKVMKVPSTAGEALKSDLMGFFQKRKCKNFFTFCEEYEPSNPKTHKGFDPYSTTMADVFKIFDLDKDTVDFVGHAVALFSSDEYLHRPAIETMERVKLYGLSFLRFGGVSPFLYPLYGLGELPQSFARLCAVCGGTYMLHKPVDSIVYNDAGEAIGVQSGEERATAKFVVGDPSYFPDKVRRVGQVVRAICLLDHPVPQTNNSASCQVIITQKQTGRHHDIYVCVMSSKHKVVPEGKFVAVLATEVETADPVRELEPAFAILGGIEERFINVSDLYEPLADGRADKCYISKSYDATSHFETIAEDVMSLYERITGKPFDFTNIVPFGSNDDEENEGASGSQ